MRNWCALIAAFAVGSLTYSVVHEARAAGSRSFTGSVSVGRIERLFEMPGSVSTRGKLGDARRFTDTRDRRFVPSHYGEVFEITAHGEDAVLWFRDGAGGVRNVKVTGASQKLVHLEKQTSRLLPVRR